MTIFEGTKRRQRNILFGGRYEDLQKKKRDNRNEIESNKLMSLWVLNAYRLMMICVPQIFLVQDIHLSHFSQPQEIYHSAIYFSSFFWLKGYAK